MGNIRPHLVRYWLHSSEKVDNPEIFSQKVNQICETYHNAPKVQKNGIHTISVDEMTGIQALERKYPDKPTAPGEIARIEFEYIRHGTTTLIAFLDVAKGQICSPYLNQTRTELDFVTAVKALIDTAPEDEWRFVCDGLNTHKSESIVRMVAQICKLDLDLGEKGKSGVLKNLQSRECFLCNPTHRICFQYTPKHCSWLNQIEIWFSILVKRLLKRMSYRSVDELKASILRFINQYNKTAKAFKWTYKGVPLTA